MKRTTLISASLLLAFAGCTCGQGWRPNFLTRFSDRIHGVNNVGEPCNAGCQDAAAAPIATGGCNTCGTTGVNYGGYEQQIGDSYEVPMGTPVGNYNSAPQSYATGPSTAYPAQTYQPQGSVRGTESIRPKPAN